MKTWIFWFLFLFGFLFLGFATGFVIHYWDYYCQPISARLHHPHHELLRPSGTLGLGCGLLGTFLIILNLSYLLRKRLSASHFLGSLKMWMGFHIFTGLIAGALILLHSAFLPKSALGILAFVALLVVMVTGLIGRYIYSWVPRTVEGREMDIEEIRKRLNDCRAFLRKFGIDSSLLEVQSISTHGHLTRKSWLSTLSILLFGDREMKQHYSKLKKAVESAILTPRGTEQILNLVKEFCQERSWLLRYHELRALMGSWRFFHRWLAIAMIFVAIFHIGVAVRYGNLWIMRYWP